MGRYSVAVVATRYGLGGSGFETFRGQESFLSPYPLIPDLVPTSPHSQRVTGPFPGGQSVDRPSYLAPRLSMSSSVFLFSIFCILCFYIVLCIVSPFVYSCLFPIYVQVCRPLTPGGNPIAVNKYHIITRLHLCFCVYMLGGDLHLYIIICLVQIGCDTGDCTNLV